MWPGISQRRRSFQSCDSSTWSTILCTCELPSYGLTKRRPRRAHWQPTRRGPVSASAGLVSWAWHRLCMGISAICLVRRLGWTSLLLDLRRIGHDWAVRGFAKGASIPRVASMWGWRSTMAGSQGGRVRRRRGAALVWLPSLRLTLDETDHRWLLLPRHVEAAPVSSPADTGFWGYAEQSFRSIQQVHERTNLVGGGGSGH